MVKKPLISQLCYPGGLFTVWLFLYRLHTYTLAQKNQIPTPIGLHLHTSVKPLILCSLHHSAALVVHHRDVGMAHEVKSPKNQPQFSQMTMGLLILVQIIRTLPAVLENK